MIQGVVSDDGTPLVQLEVCGQIWPAMIDTGFNGDLELPISLKVSLQPRFIGRITFSLAAGQKIDEDLFLVQIPLDGQLVEAEVTFVSGSTILLGTGVMKRHRLLIDFPKKSVLLERV